jgi:enoyl-CoA hydratase/carnithine racemase
MVNGAAGIRERVIELDGGGRVVWLRVDNQGKLNILDRRLSAELGERVRALADDDDLRAVVLSGAGDRAFIGGADIGEMVDLDPASARAFISTLHEACAALRTLPVPVIARIQGYCLGGGLEVAASCDLRAAADDARFAMPEVRVGIPSVIEAALLPRLAGWGKARELVYTGATFDAADALACGLVERVVPAPALDAAVDDWLDGILAAGPTAIRAQKALVRKWEELPLADAVQAGIDAFAEAYEGDEPNRLMRQFLDRPR